MTAVENGTHTASQNGAPRSWDDILLDLETKGPVKHAVPIPEWSTVVYVRGLTRNEQLRLTEATTYQKKGRSVQDTAKADQMLFMIGVVEPKPTIAHYRRLKDDPEVSPILQRIHNAITELSGIDPDEVEPKDEDEDGKPGRGGEDEAVTAAKSWLKSES